MDKNTIIMVGSGSGAKTAITAIHAQTKEHIEVVNKFEDAAMPIRAFHIPEIKEPLPLNRRERRKQSRNKKRPKS